MEWKMYGLEVPINGIILLHTLMQLYQLVQMLWGGGGAHIHSQTHNRQTVDLVTILFISEKKAKKGKGTHPLVLDSEARHVLQMFKNFNSVLFEESLPPLDQVPQTVLRGLRKEKGGRQEVTLYSDNHWWDIAAKLHLTLDNLKIGHAGSPGTGMLEVSKICISAV
jgi:hypothetical protein